MADKTKPKTKAKAKPKPKKDDIKNQDNVENVSDDISNTKTDKDIDTKVEKKNGKDKKGVKKETKRIITLVIFIIILAGIIFGIFVLVRGLSSPSPENPQEDQLAIQKEIEDVIEKIGNHLILPEGETPTMATVVDAATLIEEQPFYRNTIDGDKVLIYTQNQQAIIYSPSRDIIVNVGPVVINDQDQ